MTKLLENYYSLALFVMKTSVRQVKMYLNMYIKYCYEGICGDRDAQCETVPLEYFVFTFARTRRKG